MIMIQIYSSELFLREKDKNCVNSDQYTEYFEDIWGSKVGSIEIPEGYITCLRFYHRFFWDLVILMSILNFPHKRRNGHEN